MHSDRHVLPLREWHAHGVLSAFSSPDPRRTIPWGWILAPRETWEQGLQLRPPHTCMCWEEGGQTGKGQSILNEAEPTHPLCTVFGGQSGREDPARHWTVIGVSPTLYGGGELIVFQLSPTLTILTLCPHLDRGHSWGPGVVVGTNSILLVSMNKY